MYNTRPAGQTYIRTKLDTINMRRHSIEIDSKLTREIVYEKKAAKYEGMKDLLLSLIHI